jgi:protein TonB
MNGQKAAALPVAELASRRRGVLGAAFMAAILLHAALLFGFTLDQPRAGVPATRGERGIEVDISSFSASGSAASSAAQAQPAPPRQQEAAPSPVDEVPPEPLPSPVASSIPKRQPTRAKPAPPSAAGAAESGAAVAATEPSLASVLPAKAGDRARPESEIYNPKPVYPLLARQRGQEGETLLRVNVDAAGRVLAVDVERSSGFSLLDDAAVKGVRQWRFTPALRNGVAVAGEVLLPVHFRLQ